MPLQKDTDRERQHFDSAVTNGSDKCQAFHRSGRVKIGFQLLAQLFTLFPRIAQRDLGKDPMSPAKYAGFLAVLDFIGRTRMKNWRREWDSNPALPNRFHNL